MKSLSKFFLLFQDSDASIRKRALELVYLLVNESNVKALTKELIDYLEVSDQEFKGDLTAKICSIVSKYVKLFINTKLESLSFQNAKLFCSWFQFDDIDTIVLCNINVETFILWKSLISLHLIQVRWSWHCC